MLATTIGLWLVETATAVGWRGIVPLHSDHKQVRLKLGKPSVEMEDRMEFNRRDGKVVVFFYTKADTQNLKLSPSLAGKVLTLYFYPVKPRAYDLTALKKQSRSVGRGVTSDGESMTSYDDGERGISYHFKKDDTRVWRIVYYAPRAEFAAYKVDGRAN